MSWLGWVIACHLTVGPSESVTSREYVGRRVSFMVTNRAGQRLRECRFYLTEDQHVEVNVSDYNDGYIRYDLSVSPPTFAPL